MVAIALLALARFLTSDLQAGLRARFARDFSAPVRSHAVRRGFEAHEICEPVGVFGGVVPLERNLKRCQVCLIWRPSFRWLKMCLYEP